MSGLGDNIGWKGMEFIEMILSLDQENYELIAVDYVKFLVC